MLLHFNRRVDCSAKRNFCLMEIRCGLETASTECCPKSWMAGVTGILIGANFMGRYGNELRFLIFGLPVAALVYSAMQLRGEFLATSLLIGDTSYSIYLTHSFVMMAYTFGIRRGNNRWIVSSDNVRRHLARHSVRYCNLSSDWKTDNWFFAISYTKAYCR